MMDRKRPVTPKAWSSTGKVLPEHDVNLMLIANHPTKSSQNQTKLARMEAPETSKRCVNEVEQDRVPFQNRFDARLDNPHPLLIPHIIQNVLSRVQWGSSGAIKSARLVCSEWHKHLLEESSTVLAARSLQSVSRRYPDGLANGYDHHVSSDAPLIPLRIRNVIVEEPCINLSTPEVTTSLRNNGNHIVWLRFNANLCCVEQRLFLRRVMREYCPNIETLELISVFDMPTFAAYSEMTDPSSSIFPVYNLSKLVFKFDPQGSTGHYHDSADTRSFRSSREDIPVGPRDGGLLTHFVMNSPSLVDLTLHLEQTSVESCLARARWFGTSLRLLKRLELIAPSRHPFSAQDIFQLSNCRLKVTELVIGPIQSGQDSRRLQEFLASIASTLLSLEITGVQEIGRRSQRENTLTFTLPNMQFLQKLVIADMSRCRIGTFTDILKTAPALEQLHLMFPPVQRQFKVDVMRYVNRFFLESSTVSHVNLKDLRFTGKYVVVIHHTMVFNILRDKVPRLRSLEVSTSFMNVARVPAYMSLEHLKVLKVCIEHGRAMDFSVLFEGRVNILRVQVHGDIFLRLNHLRGLESAVDMEFEGFMFYVSEIQEIAKLLADICSSVTFTKCRISGQSGMTCHWKTLENVRLCKANLSVLLESAFSV